MITAEQEIWLAHLSATDETKILPYDPESPRKFQLVKERVQRLLPGKRVFHRGASSLGISGQGELDIYIPVPPEEFDHTVGQLQPEFGLPASVYPLRRIRFLYDVEGTKVELFVINEQSKDWIDGCAFEDYLRAHPEELLAYQTLKEEGAGLSTQEYYRRKTEFINMILELGRPSILAS